MLRLGLLLLVIPVLLLMGLYFWEYASVRACTLEGGHWDYIDRVCRDTPQPFYSLLQRYPGLVNGSMLLSVLGMVLCAMGLYTAKR